MKLSQLVPKYITKSSLNEGFNIPKGSHVYNYLRRFVAVTITIFEGKNLQYTKYKEKDTTPHEMAETIYREVLRKKKDFTDMMNIDVPKDLIQLWDKKLSHNTLYSWSRWVGYVDRPFDEDEEKTHNLYITVDDDFENLKKFIENLPKLHKEFKALSEKKKKNILWKTHKDIHDFLKDNDSFKVYFFDLSLKNDIKNVLNNWLNTYNIKTTKRQHNQGFDTKGKSFGQILSHLIVLFIVKHIKRIYDTQLKNKELEIGDVDKITDLAIQNLTKEDGIIYKIENRFEEGKVDEEKLLNYITNVKSNPEIVFTSYSEILL